MKTIAAVVGALSIAGACVLGACVSSNPSPSNGTDGGPVAQGDDGSVVTPLDSSTNDAISPTDSSSPTDAPASSCVWPDAGCSFSGTGAATGSGTCNPAQVIRSSLGAAQLVFLSPQSCSPLFEFSTIFDTVTLTPGTYTLANVEGSSGVWLSGGVSWYERKQPSVQGSISLIISSVGTVPEDDAGTLSAHGSLTAYLPGDQSGDLEDAGVTVTATF